MPARGNPQFSVDRDRITSRKFRHRQGIHPALHPITITETENLSRCMRGQLYGVYVGVVNVPRLGDGERKLFNMPIVTKG